MRMQPEQNYRSASIGSDFEMLEQAAETNFCSHFRGVKSEAMSVLTMS